MTWDQTRGKWGNFLVNQRDARKWTQEVAFDALREGLGYAPRSRGAYVRLEKGQREPSPDQQKFLVEFYGAQPTDAPVTEPDESDLAAAIRAQKDALDRQAQAIERLARAIELGSARVLEGVDGQGRLLAQLVDALAPGGRQSLLAREPHGEPAQ